MNDHHDELDLPASDEWLAKNVEVNRLLVHYFPELQEEYEHEILPGEWEKEGPMVVYSFVFHPFLERALLTEAAGSPLLDRIFEFLRMLEDHPDRSTTATVGIAEFLESHPKILQRALPRLGPKMRAAIEQD